MKSGCCTICLEPLFKDIQVSHCGHVFHRSCIYRWIDSANTCPNCKQHLDASELTNLFLDPVEIIKEVLNDPTVLENVDSELLLKLATSNKMDDDDDDDDDEEDSDVDLEILNLKKKDKKKDKKKGNVKMELIESKIKNTALTNANNELNNKFSELLGKLRIVEDEKSDLNRKIQGYLKTAQIYEEKYFCAEEKLSKLNRQIFDKNKEINSNKQHIETLIRQSSLYEHCDNIMIGNFDAVNNIEIKIDSTKSAEEQNKHYQSMYHWILKEYKRSQSDKERDKRNNQCQQKKWSEIHEEQRIKIEELTQCGMSNVDKLNKYKKHYYGLREKYVAQKEKLKFYHEKCIKLKEKLKNKINDNDDDEEEENKMPDINKLDIEKKKNGENNEDEINSISYSEQENMENVENVDPEKHDLNKNGNDGDDEDDDLEIIKKHNMNNIDLNDGNGIFSYPTNGGGINQNSMGFRKQRTSNSLFGAYRLIKSQKDGQRNPFSNNSNNNNKRKRNFTQFSKGDDGRGGTKTFLTENTNFHNNNKNKRRRIVKSSSNANNNNRNNRNNNNNNNKKTNIAKYFQKSIK